MMNEILALFNGDLQQAEEWLDTPLPVLDGETPRALIESGRGKIVADLLEEMKSGFAA
jgi:uncharacterized protein (DUF2384 family)